MIRIVVGGLLGAILGFIVGAGVGALLEFAVHGLEPSLDWWELLIRPDYTVVAGLLCTVPGLFLGAIIGSNSQHTQK